MGRCLTFGNIIVTFYNKEDAEIKNRAGRRQAGRFPDEGEDEMGWHGFCVLKR